MIEVEIKIQVTKEQKERLISDAKYIASEQFIDEYFDTPAFALTTKGYWLRKRNNKFELKMPANAARTFNIHKNIAMQEITDPTEIAQFLNLNKKNNLDSELMRKDYRMLYRFTNYRSKYAYANFIIDFDTADFGDLIYTVCEIETFVKQENQAEQALRDLYNFAKSFGIDTTKAEGKLGYYIKRKNPAHYSALLQNSK